MANYVFVAKSLDGFIATKDGSTKWLNIANTQKTDYGYTEFVKKIDAIIMGRLSYEKILTYIPYPYKKHVFVLSNTLKTIPINLSDRIDIVNGKLKDIVENLRNKGFENLYIDGGTTIQSFLKEDLIDEMMITTVPIILGGGIPLFGELNTTLNFKHKRTTTYDNGLVTSIYTK